jgi:hypothetical protein
MASKDDRGQDDQRPVFLGQQGVDKQIDGQRETQFQDADDHGAAEVQIEESIRAIIGEKLTKH